MLDGFKADGHVYKAAGTLRWIKTLWKWAAQRDLVTINVMAVVTIEFKRRERNRVYSDQEVRAIWNAANNLDAAESTFIKLLILLAPRKTALASMRRSDLDNVDSPTLWTTPFELTKSRESSSKKRVYLTPLAPLAQRVIKGLVKIDEAIDFVFMGLPVHRTKPIARRSMGSICATN
jgi:integrase